MAILELQFPQRPRERTKHIKESYKCRSDTAWNDLLDVWAWKPEAQARNNTDRTNVYKILNKETIDLQLLIRISKLLHHDFLLECSKTIGVV